MPRTRLRSLRERVLARPLARERIDERGRQIDAGVTLMVAGRSYPVDVEAAHWLATELRDTFTDTDADLTEKSLAVAKAIDVALETGDQEPLELGWPAQIQGVAYVLHRPGTRRDGGLDELADAIRRFGATD